MKSLARLLAALLIAAAPLVHAQAQSTLTE